MSTEITTIENTEIQLAFTSPNGIDILLERIRKEASSEVPDLTTAKGRARIASLAHKVSKTKVLVDDYGKELVAEEKKRLALIDADRKKWRDTCDAIRDEIRKPLTDWEAAERAERERVAAVEQERQRAERERIAAEQKAAAEQAARDADKEHRRTVNRTIMAAFEDFGVDSDTAKKLISAIVAGSVPHVSIKY